MKAWEAGEILGDERLKTYMMQIMREAGWEGACGRLSSPATVARAYGKAGGTEHPSGQLEEQQETGRIPSCRIITPGIKPKKGSLTRGVAPALEAKAVSRGSGIFPPL